MSAQSLVEELRRLGGEIKLDNGHLRVAAPRGAISPELHAQLKATRDELIDYLRQRSEASERVAEPIAAHPRDVPTRLSRGQRQLWFVEQVNSASAVHNVPGALRIRGPLDVERLQQTLSAVVRRHDALCVSIEAPDGEPVARLHNLEVRASVRDLTGNLGAEQAATLERERLEFSSEPFVLAVAPLIRFRLFVLGPDDHVLAVVASHLVYDGASQAILFDDIRESYFSQNLDDTAPVSARTCFRDYAEWDLDQATRTPLARERAYWEAALKGMPAVLELPTPKTRPSKMTHRGEWGSFEIGPQLCAQLREIATAHRASLNMLLLASIQLLLARYSGQEDFGVGVPVNDRSRPDCERTIGLFVNTLVMRSQVPQGGTFSQLLERVRDTSLDALDHRGLSTADLVQLLQPDRDLSRNPAYQTIYSHQRIATAQKTATDVSFVEIPAFAGAAITDIDFYCFEYDRHAVASVQVASDLFDTAALHRLMRSWLRVLSEVAANPTRAIELIPVISESDERFLLHELNGTQVPWDSTALIHRWFEQAVDERPDEVAVRFEEDEITWSVLDRRANRLAHELVARNVTTGDRVGVCLERGIELVVAILAVLKSGAGYVPLDPTHPPERIAQVLADASARILISSSRVAEKLEAAAPLLLIDRDAATLQSRSDRRLSHPESSSQLAYVIYTSGSTGRPKGVMVEHRNVISFLVGMEQAIGLDSHGTWLSATTVAFDMSVVEILGSLTHGRKLVLLGETVLGQVADSRYSIPALVARHRVTHFQCTPSQCRALMLSEEGRSAIAALEQLIVGGEPLPPDLAASLHKILRGQLINGYGPTETTVFSTTAPVLKGEPIHIGRPIANTAVLVLDDRQRLVPFGSIGELYLGGPGVTRGYLGQPELTAERFGRSRYFGDSDIQFYRTGDLVRYLPNGDILYLGRNDHQVKLRGFRIELGEVEAALRAVPGVTQAAVVARGQGDEKRLVAYLTAGADYAGDAGCRASLRARLPEYMIPSVYVRMASFPLTPSGKLDRKALPEPVVTTPDDVALELPADELETQMLELWQNALCRPQISVTSNFFDLGGHSLLAVRLFNEINVRFSVRLPLADLFEYPTPRQLAQRTRALLPNGQSPIASDWTTVVRMQTRGSLPPLFCVAGLGGNPLNLRHLVSQLGEEQPFYGLQHRGVDGVLEPHRSIEEMAREFLADIRAVQARGPYYLAGYSAGGLAAYELARLLIAMGEEVPLVVLLDTFNPLIAEWPLRARVEAHLARIRTHGVDYVWTRALAGARYRIERVKKFVRSQLATFRRYEYRMDAVEAATLAAERAFVPRALDTSVLLVQTRFEIPAESGIGYPPHESNGWRGLVRGDLQITQVECHHLALVSERIAPITAAIIREGLLKARDARTA